MTVGSAANADETGAAGDMPTDVTRDALLGGRVRIAQPARGYRAGVDAVYLAAACPARPGERVLDLGCGVGAATLCLAARVPGLVHAGVERDPTAAALARANAAQAGLAMEVTQADIADLPAALRRASFDHVIANPPYFRRDASVPAGEAYREAAMGEATPLAVWLEVAARRLAPKGWLTLVHRPDRLGDILGNLRDLGSVAVQPLAPRAGRRAHLVLLRARKGGRAPLVLHAPLTVHAGAVHEGDAEDYTPALRAVLRDGAALPGFDG
jgi:tRNA1(Val) A37 N6-methylase TrmN6